MHNVLHFDKEGLIGIHVFSKHLEFPVAFAAYSDWEKQQLKYLCANFTPKRFGTKEICNWGKSHRLKYQLIYPVTIFDILIRPFKYIRFLRLRKELSIPLRKEELA